MSEIDWDRLRIFHAVADAGSLTHAGEALGLSQSAVSRQIRSLEETVGTTLFHRHARGLILTEQGELMFEATQTMLKSLESATARIRDAETETIGELRVTTTVGFGTLWLVPRLPRLFEQYPDLSIQLMLEERVLDIPMREADVAIRMKEPSQADLVRRKLMDIRMRFYCSKAYMDTYGLPQSDAELAERRLIGYIPDSPQVSAGRLWLAPYLSDSTAAVLTVNSYYGVLEAVRSGLGIGGLPEYLAADNPDLIHVLPESASEAIPIYFTYAQELRHSSRVSAFRDFMIAEITEYRKGLA